MKSSHKLRLIKTELKIKKEWLMKFADNTRRVRRRIKRIFPASAIHSKVRRRNLFKEMSKQVQLTMETMETDFYTVQQQTSRGRPFSCVSK